MLRGRGAECAAIDAAIQGLRSGRGGRLVVRGQAGTGKSSLLAYAAERAEGLRVLTATGVESETAFAYSGLHELLRPVVDIAADLPAPQVHALRAALGLTDGEADRFLVSLAALGILSDVAADGLVCVVDDVQWLDPATTDALTFAARRLEAEPILFLFAVREPEGATVRIAGAQQLTLQGLGPEDAAAILTDSRGAVVHPAVARRIADKAEGNPAGVGGARGEPLGGGAQRCRAAARPVAGGAWRRSRLRRARARSARRHPAAVGGRRGRTARPGNPFHGRQAAGSRAAAPGAG